jgi:hypothetical protein
VSEESGRSQAAESLLGYSSVAAPDHPRSSRAGAVFAWTLIALMALAAPVTLLFPKFAKIERGALWGAVVLVSMAGWGALVERLAFPRTKADLGLRLAWGAGALVAVGGLLCLVSVATAPVLLVLVLGGVALSLMDAARARRDLGARVVAWVRFWPSASLIVFLSLAILTGFYYFAGASGAILNLNDDQVAYLSFPQKILATGTLLDPFSVRRITAFGGHSFLQALTVVGAASPLQISILDLGLSLVITLALMLGAIGRRTAWMTRVLWVLPALVLVTMQNIRANSASEMSGVLFFLAMYRTATSQGFKERPVAGGVLLALLGAAACTLRQSYLVPVAVFMVVLYLPSLWAATRADAPERKRRLVEIGVAAGALVLFLAPWALLSHLSHRTFLFPVVTGNYRPNYGAFKTDSLFVDRVKFLWMNICFCNPVHSIPVFLLAGLLIPWRRTNGALPALLWASFIGFVLVVFSIPLSDQWNIARYYYGFAVASVMATMLAALSLPRGDRLLRPRVLLPAALVVIATVAQIEEAHPTIYPDYVHLGTGILVARSHPSILDDAGDNYRKLQGTIPAGVPLLVMVDESFWFDFRRNRVDLVDLPGAASPEPGMPLEDDEKLVSYLKGQGYRYIAFVRSTASKSLYQRDHWNKVLVKPGPEIWKLSAPFYLKMFDRFDSLAKSRLRLYEDANMMALDLGTPAKAPEPVVKAAP